MSQVEDPLGLRTLLRAPMLPAEVLDPAGGQREHSIARMRGAQARLLVRREQRALWRRRLGLGALLCVPIAAAAAAAAGGAFRHPAPDVREAVVASPRAIVPAVGSEAPLVAAVDRAVSATRGSEVPPPVRDVRPPPMEQLRNPAGRVTHGRAPGPVEPVAREARSTLGEENALLARALVAARNGEHRRSVSLLDELLRRHPGSPLAQNAQVERFRALRHLGDGAAAAHAARRYLGQYPDGMASDEARRIAVDEPSTGSRP